MDISSSANPAASAPAGGAAISLAQLHLGARGTVLDVSLPSQAGESAEAAEDAAMILRRLMEIGFVVGEGFEIVAEAKPGGDPIAVRVGGSIFALRRREAAMVTVHPAIAGGAS